MTETDTDTAADTAARVLRLEAQGLTRLADHIPADFAPAAAAILGLQGRVIVSGMGKSGHVASQDGGDARLDRHARPVSSIPAEASARRPRHDRRPATSAWLLSRSGETRRAGPASSPTRATVSRIPLVAMTAEANSALGAAADIALVLPRAEEACPNKLAPTTSTTMQLALGDALAIALLEARRASGPRISEAFHPGGKLGARMRRVSDLMHGADSLPLVGVDRRCPRRCW
ncbi:SIS domain-containing protein [Rhodophyticola sp.]|uniref:SIS domain-containing protein n=1 Tax=Rhodophyticola sp. TaxID=2680032 RepID=UPI003D2831EA